jgi:hypothetical protein
VFFFPAVLISDIYAVVKGKRGKLFKGPLWEGASLGVFILFLSRP